jgi:Ca2+-binding EF-hand superfamily protein
VIPLYPFYRFEYPRDPAYVCYEPFCDEIESIFTTKHLEKAPQVKPIQFKPPDEVSLNILDKDAEIILQRTLARLSEQVRKANIQMYTLFEDYDRVHNGTVSQSQFRRVLSELELGSLVNETEFQVLYKKFDVKVGGKDDMNYIAFCDIIYKMANIELFKP